MASAWPSRREAPSPRIAVVNLLPEGKGGAVEISGQTVKLADLQASLAGGKVQTVTVNTRADALRRIDRGELDGALIIPADAASRLRAQLGSGGVADGPELEILYRESGPLDGVLVRSLVGSRLRTAERTLASEIVRVSTSFLTLLRDGGTITVFGQQVEYWACAAPSRSWARQPAPRRPHSVRIWSAWRPSRAEPARTSTSPTASCAPWPSRSRSRRRPSADGRAAPSQASPLASLPRSP